MNRSLPILVVVHFDSPKKIKKSNNYPFAKCKNGRFHVTLFVVTMSVDVSFFVEFFNSRLPYLHSQGYQQTVPPQDKDSTIRVTICQRSRNAELHSQ